MTDLLWRHVNRLTKPQRFKLTRDSGTIEHVETPSLWAQLEDALGHSGNGGGGRTKPGSRPPLNVSVASLMFDVESVTVDALISYELAVRHTVPGSLRALVAHLVSTTDAPVDWWTDQTRVWAAHAETTLGLDDGGTATRGIRGFSCPDCQARYVTRWQDGIKFRDPAVVVAFREHMVRNLKCRVCGACWWRGAELEAMADRALGLRDSA